MQGSKAAALTMTEALAMELHHFGITVTSIIPGYVKSDYVANSLTDSERCELYLRPSCKQKLRPSQCICILTLLFQCVSKTHQLFCGLFC